MSNDEEDDLSHNLSSEEFKELTDIKNNNNELKLRLTIKKKEVNPIEKYRDKIYEFRSMFDLREEDHDDEKLFNLLIENDFNNEKAFEQLFL